MAWRQIQWIAEDGDDPVVWVSTAKLDAAWQLAGSPWYIPHGGCGSFKYQRFGNWLALNEPVIMPVIGLHEGMADFANGRHRFAWLRDHGLKALPINVDPGQPEEIGQVLGTRSRLSRVLER